MNPQIQKQWKEYQTKRDEILAIHRQAVELGRRAPKNVWMFATQPRELFRRFHLPLGRSEAWVKRWLKAAIARCEDALSHPNDYPTR